MFTLESIHATVYPSMISAPNKSVEAFIGDTVSFEWHYNSGDLKNDLFEVVFGIWKSPVCLKTKSIAVNSSGFASARSSYKSSVCRAGNLTSSTAVFELYNVKLEDGKKYGIVVEHGLQNIPLTDSSFKLSPGVSSIVQDSTENIRFNSKLYFRLLWLWFIYGFYDEVSG